MTYLSPDQEDALKQLVAQFVTTYMGDLNYYPLSEAEADYIGDTFFGMLMDGFVYPDGPPDEHDDIETL